MKKFLLVFLLNVFCLSFAQQDPHPPKSDSQKVESIATSANFPAGADAFSKLLAAKFNAQNIGCEISGSQNTIIEFVVEKDGSISEIKSFGRNVSLNREAVRVVQSIKEKWNPAILSNGEKARYKFKQSFKYFCE